MYWIIWYVGMHLYYCSNPVHVKCVAQMVKCLSAMQDTWVWSLGWEGPLEKEMAAHSSSLAWKIPWMEEPGRLQSMGLQRVRHDWVIPLSLLEGVDRNGILNCDGHIFKISNAEHGHMMFSHFYIFAPFLFLFLSLTICKCSLVYEAN